ncbi:sensor histidine kinase [Paenibacillus thermoaerophilus]|uniref:Sensor histidine kinase n=1 Tax=Paenibacillus thermoaerophilus TaxID=1215385 RepID=A0ABW2V9D1_9BACL|nr:sensor histidine kinase [Paenibacillus thermoaerophilus]TMV17937.1 sensor histidine kinase [Paenibacillus thermoaerophilus]
MSLRKKLLFAFTLFVIVPLIGLGIGSYMLGQQIIEKKFNEQSATTIEAMSRNIGYMFKEANYYSDVWLVKPEIQSLYRVLDGSAAEISEWPFYENTLRKTLLTFNPIKAVALYGKDNLIIRAGRDSIPAIPYEQLIQHPVYNRIKQLNGVPLWIGPEEYPELTGSLRYFDQIRVVKDFYTMDNRGLLSLRFQFSELDRIFRPYASGDQGVYRYLIVGQSGIVLYDNRRELEGKRIGGELPEFVLESDGLVSGKTDFLGTPSMVMSSPLGLEDMGVFGWRIVSIAPLQYVTGEVNLLLEAVGAILLFGLASALLFNNVFVGRTVRAILRVVASMKRVERGDLSTRLRVAGNDELTVLAKGFNSLIGRVEDLLEEVKREQDRKNRAELMLMQAQIKPHFLFNTLESINTLAIQNQGRQVSQMVQKLGKLLRISIHPDEEITVSQEIEHLRSYLDIQMFRFVDSFVYEIVVPDELGDRIMPKLTLQPLVENCLQHGFEGLDRTGRITIKIREERGDLVFYVADNGRGIQADRLARFGSEPDDKTSPTPVGREHLRLGVRSVADRIRIMYGSRYGITICSAEGYGTTIRGCMPLRRRDEP